MDVVLENGNDVRMPRTLSWLVWGAVVVAGSILSFEIWKRALEPTPNAVGQAPQTVQPSAERKVPALISPTPSSARSSHGPSPVQGGALFGGSSPVISPVSGGAAILLPGAGGGGTG